MVDIAEQPVLDFYIYPSVGPDDWEYAFAAACARSLETQLLSHGTFLDMANAENFEAALELLSSTQYSLGSTSKSFADVENTLLEQRSHVRKTFSDLVVDEKFAEPLKIREDFANMRLALRRKLTEKPLGSDYSKDGSVPGDEFEAIFEEENYAPLPIHIQEAIEQAVLAYYQDKDIRQIDHALDKSHFEFKLKRAEELKNTFILELFRMQIDLTNIRTMLRLKFTESQTRDVFISGGYVDSDKLKHGLDIGYEALAPLFFATPYFDIVEAGAAYLNTNNSFLKLEQKCEDHLMGFLKTTSQITAGIQPVIAYLLRAEYEIRTVRLILTAKKNALDTKLILDRLGE
ncbi:V-type ATPase subunit [Planctomycetota bacterium]